MRHALLAGIAAIAAIAFVPSANATLQLSIGANGSTFTCADGQLGCDLSGGANNLLTVNTLVGGAFVQITLVQSVAGTVNSLQMSSSNIENQSGAPIVVTLLASQTDFLGPVSAISNSGSLTGLGDTGVRLSAKSESTDRSL